jgi:hypothetical protein
MMNEDSEPRIVQHPTTGMLYTNRPLTEDELAALNRTLFGSDSPQPQIALGTLLRREER